jgi:signal transduction histidine kinase
LAQPLRRQVAFVAVILTAAAAGAIAYSARLTYIAHLRQLETDTKTMAAMVVLYVNTNLQIADVAAATASRNPLLARLDPQAAGEVLQPLLTGRRRLVQNALMADADGRVMAWARPPTPGLDAEVEPDWLRSVAQRNQTLMSRLLGAPGGDMHIIWIGYPIPGATGGVAGVLGISVHLEAFEQVLASIPLPEGSVVTLTDEQSVVVARSLDSRRYVGRPVEAPGQSLPPERVPATVVRTGVDGVERVFGNGVIERGPWVASVGIPTAVARGRTAPIYRRNLAIAASISILLLVLTATIGRQWLPAFDHFDRTAKRVAAGDLSAIEFRTMPAAEMERLQQTFSDMVTNLRAAREAVAAQIVEERRMREEVQLLQQQVIRQERLAAIGVLVSGVAHELNNPLQGILGFAELLQMRPNMPAEARAELALIQKESARASAIIRNLSRFGRQNPEPSPVRLSDVVASVMELRQRKLEELGIDVDVDERSTATVMAVFTELQQVALNFVINAEQAIVQSGGPAPRIAIRTSDRGTWASLEVEDSGLGVRPEDEAKLFQPFYTTKPVGEGTGLGLSVSYNIIRSHGGRIGYRAAPGGGALFYFELPIARASGSAGSPGSSGSA